MKLYFPGLLSTNGTSNRSLRMARQWIEIYFEIPLDINRNINDERKHKTILEKVEYIGQKALKGCRLEFPLPVD